jgi:hypothetical protein
MAETVQTHPCTSVDRDAALKNVKEHAEVVGEPREGYEFAVSMHGSSAGPKPAASCAAWAAPAPSATTASRLSQAAQT